MSVLYNLGIQLYYLLLKLVSFFHLRAGSLVKGQRDIFKRIDSIDLTGKWVWFHMASAGEFEQARPVIERVKSDHAELRLLLTFYSPSGFEYAKHFTEADLITFLPIDTPSNAQRMTNSFELVLACFVKGEFWLNYLKELNRQSVPVINFNSVFRTNQVFFKNYGALYRSFLFKFDQILLQDQASLDLLKSIGYKGGQVCGDTRFDRVLDVANSKMRIPMITEFKGKSPLLIAGSAWPSDMKIITPVVREIIRSGIKVVIVPHQTDAHAVDALLRGIELKAIRYSKVKHTQLLKEFDLLVIDEMGLLSSIYGHADLAYIGGAFRGALHNTLEAVVYGTPVIFGKHHSNIKFIEAQNLLALGAAFEVETPEEFLLKTQALIADKELINQAGISGKNYVSANGGATNRILNVMNEYLRPYK